MRLAPQDRCGGLLRGRPTLYTVPQGADPYDATARRLLQTGRNTICYGFYDAMQRYLLRDFDAWSPTGLVLGYGGDYDQPDDPDTTAPSDQGARIAPAVTDAYVRKVFYRGAVQQAKEGSPTTDRRVVYVAVVKPSDGVTDVDDVTRPYLNEIGLEARNGVLLAHYVTDVDPDTGRAQRFAKAAYQWLVCEWEIEFVGVLT